MTTAEVLERIAIPRTKLYYLEQKGYIRPRRRSMGELEAREYSEWDLKRIEAIWKFLKQGFRYRIAYQKACEELGITEPANVEAGFSMAQEETKHGN